MARGLTISLIFTLFLTCPPTGARGQGISWQATSLTCAGPDCPPVVSSAVNTRDVIFAGMGGGPAGIHRSTDGGFSWTPLDAFPNGGAPVHLVVDGRDSLFAGTGTGVFRSPDDGDSWTQVLAGASVLAMSIDSIGVVYAGCGDGAIHRSTDGGDSWEMTETDRAAAIRAIVPGRNGHVFAGSPDGGIFRNSGYSSVWHTVDGGSAVHSLTVDGSGTIFAGTGSGGVMKTSNGGSSWYATNAAGFPFLVLSLAVNSLDHVFAGTSSDGAAPGIFRSTDGGLSWAPCNDGVAAAADVNTIAFTSDGVGYAGVGGTLYRTSGPTTAVGDGPASVPDRAGLIGSYPNPFNPSTTVAFSMERTGHAALEVFDVFGRRVATLFDGMAQPGTHRESWNAAVYAGGTYFVRFTAAGTTDVGRLLLVK